jgi:Glyoxalase-like domain
MVQNKAMRLDHVSYVTSHDQLADTVQRLGSRLGTTFVDGGIHPRFGTRNFTAPLLDGKYIEVVCPLDHPATEQTPWGKAVSKKAQEGGGWLTWVFSTDDISPIEEKFGRKAVDGHRTRPDGTDLKWKQIGVKEITDSRELPFFIQWLTEDHPSKDGNAIAKITKILIADEGQLSNSWFKEDILRGLSELQIEWVEPSDSEGITGILSVQIEVTNQIISID